MCGISGIWNWTGESIDHSEMKSFNNSLIHRGPDAEGYAFFESDGLALGHRRLSIIDLTKLGNQPMYCHTARYCAVYNGEVFNFKDIRNDLMKLGINFKSNSDTEVIIAAYVKYGLDCFSMFNGMWAIAIWDSLEKELLICRDRFGIKPFYFLFEKGKRFAFASETIAFGHLKNFNKEINKEIAKYESKGISTYGNGYSIFNGIYQLVGGHFAQISKKSNEVHQKRWYNINDNITQTISCFESQKDEFSSLFNDSCKIRLESDVKIGTALSGGLDSSAVYSTVYDLLKGNKSEVHEQSNVAYIATFKDLPQDEEQYARKALNFTNGNGVFLENNYNNLIESIEYDTKQFDTMINAPITSVSNIYKGMKRNNVSVSLDGHGVDEMLFGYREMLIGVFIQEIRKGVTNKSNAIKKYLISTYLPNQQKGVEMYLNSLEGIKHKIKQSVNKLIYTERYTHESMSNQFPYLGEDLTCLNENMEFSIPYWATFNKTLPAILRDFDRASMMNSVEIRMPFLDYRLVEFFFSLPFDSKFGGGMNKRIVREAMKGKMNEEIRLRKIKVGIGSPVEYWFKNELSEWVLDQLFTIKRSHSQYLLNNKFIDKFEKDIKNNKLNSSQIDLAWKEINLHLINN
jgi:asparagine synthase (glutamine-hydrolysing)